ncbi:single-stranded DNA-binding protein [Enterobacter roggenkampii]
MTAQLSAYGRLVADPQTRTTNSGTSMAMARLAVALPCHAAEGGEVTFWLGVVAFGKQADALAGHVIRLKVTEYLFFAAGHSHGWLIPYCGIEVSYNKAQKIRGQNSKHESIK